MARSLHSPSLGNLPANLAAPLPNKIDLMIAKERGAGRRRLSSGSTGNHMRTESGSSTNGNNGAESVRIWKARNFIHEHSSEEISLVSVAKASNTSANYLSEKFKEATGVNYVKYVARMRFEKAATLLREANLRVSEIAFASGFQSLSQFNRVFKKLAGKAPTEYRRAMQRR